MIFAVWLTVRDPSFVATVKLDKLCTSHAEATELAATALTNMPLLAAGVAAHSQLNRDEALALIMRAELLVTVGPDAPDPIVPNVSALALAQAALRAYEYSLALNGGGSGFELLQGQLEEEFDALRKLALFSAPEEPMTVEQRAAVLTFARERAARPVSSEIRLPGDAMPTNAMDPLK